MPAIKGTASIASDAAQSKLLRTTKFPSCFARTVDLNKVNVPVITQWIESEVTKLLGFEDEIVASTAVNLFFPQLLSDDSSSEVKYGTVDPRNVQINLAGFLGDDTPNFVETVWVMLLDAQEQPNRIPRALIEAKKAELKAASDNKSRHEPSGERRPTNNRDANRNIDNGTRSNDRSRQPNRSSQTIERGRHTEDHSASYQNRRPEPSYGGYDDRDRRRSPPRHYQHRDYSRNDPYPHSRRYDDGHYYRDNDYHYRGRMSTGYDRSPHQSRYHRDVRERSRSNDSFGRHRVRRRERSHRRDSYDRQPRRRSQSISSSSSSSGPRSRSSIRRSRSKSRSVSRRSYRDGTAARKSSSRSYSRSRSRSRSRSHSRSRSRSSASSHGRRNSYRRRSRSRSIPRRRSRS